MALWDRDHRFPWKWYLHDLDQVPKNGKKVFSCFSCGGGSSMGYKLAGYEMVGCCEIDPRMVEIYRKNLHPALVYNMDIRELLKGPLQKVLYDLDILDGSPPCSTFSFAGRRDEDWGKEKTFREGQAKQRLDDLFFHFIAVAKELQPKVVIAENVAGLIKGKAKGYVNEIFKAFQDAGYDAQLFLLNAAYMGVPQRRERTIFIARRKDLNLPRIQMNFQEPPIHFGAVRSEHGVPINHDTQLWQLLQRRKPEDRKLSDIHERWSGKMKGYTTPIVKDDDVPVTLCASGGMIRDYDCSYFSDQDCINIQTFPQDYDFGKEAVEYVCGMSVPPVMMAQIATEVYEQWLKS